MVKYPEATTKKNSKKNILFIDQGIAFGGSLVVTAAIANNLDKEKYNIFTNIEVEDEDVKKLFRNGKIYLHKHLYNYALQEKFALVINKYLPRAIARYVLILFIMNSFIRAIINIPYILKIHSLIKRQNVDILHVSNGVGNFELCIATLFTKPKIIVHLHGMRSIDRVCSHMLKQCSQFLSISQYIKDEMIKRGLDDKKFTIVYNPLPEYNGTPDFSVERTRTQLNIDANEKVIGLFGRIVGWKGHLQLIDAINEVVKTDKNIKILIVGDRSDGGAGFYEEVQQRIEHFKLNKYFIFTGFTKNTDDYYKLCDFTVHTSIEPEPFGLVIIESMRNGVPVIASKYGAAPEIITHGEDGMIADPLDKYALSKAISYLLANPAKLSSMRQNARKNAEERFSLEKYISNIENIYETVLEKQ